MDRTTIDCCSGSLSTCLTYLSLDDTNFLFLEDLELLVMASKESLQTAHMPLWYLMTGFHSVVGLQNLTSLQLTGN